MIWKLKKGICDSIEVDISILDNIKSNLLEIYEWYFYEWEFLDGAGKHEGKKYNGRCKGGKKSKLLDYTGSSTDEDCKKLIEDPSVKKKWTLKGVGTEDYIKTMEHDDHKKNNVINNPMYFNKACGQKGESVLDENRIEQNKKIAKLIQNLNDFCRENYISDVEVINEKIQGIIEKLGYKKNEITLQQETVKDVYEYTKAQVRFYQADPYKINFIKLSVLELGSNRNCSPVPYVVGMDFEKNTGSVEKPEFVTVNEPLRFDCDHTIQAQYDIWFDDEYEFDDKCLTLRINPSLVERLNLVFTDIKMIGEFLNPLNEIRKTPTDRDTAVQIVLTNKNKEGVDFNSPINLIYLKEIGFSEDEIGNATKVGSIINDAAKIQNKNDRNSNDKNVNWINWARKDSIMFLHEEEDRILSEDCNNLYMEVSSGNHPCKIFLEIIEMILRQHEREKLGKRCYEDPETREVKKLDKSGEVELLTKTKQHDFSKLHVRVKHPSQEKKDNWDKSKSKHGKSIDVICEKEEVTVWGYDKEGGSVIKLPDWTSTGTYQKRHIEVIFLDDKTSKKSII